MMTRFLNALVLFVVAHLCFVQGFSLTQYSTSGCMGIPSSTLSGISSTSGTCVPSTSGSINVVCNADGSYSVSYFESRVGCSGTAITSSTGAQDGVCTNVVALSKMMGSVSVICDDIITANPTAFGPPTTPGPPETLPPEPTTPTSPPTTPPMPFTITLFSGNTCASTTQLRTATGTTTKCLASSTVPLIVNCSNGNFTLQFYNSTKSCSSIAAGPFVSGVCNQCTTFGGGMESVMVDCNIVVPPPQSGSATSFTYSSSHTFMLLMLLLIVVAATQHAGVDIVVNSH